MVLDGIITHFRELDLFIHAKYVSNFQFCFIVSCQWFFFSSLYFLSFLKVPSRNSFSCNFFFLQSKFHFLYKTANTQCIAVFFLLITKQLFVVCKLVYMVFYFIISPIKATLALHLFFSFLNSYFCFFFSINYKNYSCIFTYLPIWPLNFY